MYYLKLLDKFSLLTVGDDKIPNFGWKKLQTQKLTKEQFLTNYQYSSGKTFTDSDGVITEIKGTKNVGIITGFEDLEVIDIDLKVFSTAKEKTDFWNEYLGYLRDNILDFDDKFVIYKTMNDGYHILYKSKRCDKNTKIAKLKGHTEAIIETRGKYGYVFIYENNKFSLSYSKDNRMRYSFKSETLDAHGQAIYARISFSFEFKVIKFKHRLGEIVKLIKRKVDQYHTNMPTLSSNPSIKIVYLDDKFYIKP